MYTELDYLPDIKHELRSLISECQRHIKNNTFDEKTFTNCFNYFIRYTNVLINYSITHDDVDTSPMTAIQDYYNIKSTLYTYNIVTKERKEKEIISDRPSKKIWDFIDRNENIIIFGGLFILLFFLLRSCAHGESIDEALSKYVLVNPGSDKVIEFIDEDYKLVNNEIFNPEEFVIHRTR